MMWGSVEKWVVAQRDQWRRRMMVMAVRLAVDVQWVAAMVRRLLMGWLDFNGRSTLNTGHGWWRNTLHWDRPRDRRRYWRRNSWAWANTDMQIARQTEVGNVVVVRRSKRIGRRRRQMVMVMAWVQVDGSTFNNNFRLDGRHKVATQVRSMDSPKLRR